MEIRVHARHVDVSPEVRALAEQKLQAVGRLLPPDATADVEFSEERNPRIARKAMAELTILARGRVLRAKVAEAAFRDAIIHAVRSVQQEASDLHDRRRSHPHRVLKTNSRTTVVPSSPVGATE